MFYAKVQVFEIVRELFRVFYKVISKMFISSSLLIKFNLLHNEFKHLVKQRQNLWLLSNLSTIR